MCEASRPTFRIHISSAHRGARKNHLFRPLTAFLFLFLVAVSTVRTIWCRILREIIYFHAGYGIFARRFSASHARRFLCARDRRQNLLSSRGLCMISRETVWASRDQERIFARYCLISRDLENVFARDCISSRDLKSFFAQTVRISREILRQQFYFSCIDFASFRIFAANCSWFHIFVFFDFFGTA